MGNLNILKLHNLPMAFLNKRQRRKIRERNQRQQRYRQASFIKSEAFKVASQNTKKDEGIVYSLEEAFEEIESQDKPENIDESIDVCIKLGIDPIKSDQQVRAVVELPAGTGREIKVAVFTSQESMPIAQKAGADMIVDLDHISEITAETLQFDTLLATRDVINLLRPFGRTIGPLGLMPNVKSGTLVNPDELQSTVKSLKAGKIEIRNDSHAVLHACLGKRRFTREQLIENFEAIGEKLKEKKPDLIQAKKYIKW